jgi:hypothetical protein
LKTYSGIKFLPNKILQSALEKWLQLFFSKW